MPKLGVNIDHVATIREARKIDYPDPVEAARLCQEAGADSIVCHLREDRRHIQDSDLYKIKRIVESCQRRQNGIWLKLSFSIPSRLQKSRGARL